MCLSLGLDKAFSLDIDLFQRSLNGGDGNNEDKEEGLNQGDDGEDSDQGSDNGCLQIHN